MFKLKKSGEIGNRVNIEDRVSSTKYLQLTTYLLTYFFVRGNKYYGSLTLLFRYMLPFKIKVQRTLNVFDGIKLKTKTLSKVLRTQVETKNH